MSQDRIMNIVSHFMSFAPCSIILLYNINQYNALFLKQYFNILIYIQPDATLHSLFYLETALHISGGTITHHQERKQQYLQHLVFDTQLRLYYRL
jgi:hypothetical protein